MRKFYFLRNVVAIAICLASFLSANNVLAQTSPNILVDFSTLDNASNNAQQQGWNVSGIMYEIATAGKYLVLETEGTGDGYSEGFTGMQFIFQGNDGAAIEVGWTQRNLNGDWISLPRAEGKTVSIAIDLANALHDQYMDFLYCTWARILIGYYNGTTAFEGLGLKGAYLTDDFDKPAGAVDLNSGFGFIFEGSVVGGVIPKDKEYLPMGKDSDLEAGWNSSYEAASRTITFDEDWNAGRGWWFGSKDCSDYVQVVVEIEPTDAITKLVVLYADGTENEPDVFAEAGETLLVVNLDPAKKNDIKQIYLQRETAGEVVLVEAYLTANSVTSISNVPAVATLQSVSVIGYYTITGQRLQQAPEKGIYIIMYDNGKSEKVVR